MKRPSPATIIASVALFFSLAGTGLAASKYLITSTKQIKPSVLSSLRGAQGPRGLQGAQGAAGPAGPAGAAGAAGAAGTFNTSDVSVVTGTNSAIGANAQGNAQATAAATCPAGSTVIGGGYTWYGGAFPGSTADPGTVTVVQDGPNGANGWVVVIQENSTSAGTGSAQFVAQAQCAS
jgi:hypothetical protein